jgi:hypothetical protein
VAEEKKSRQDRMIEILEEMLRWAKVTSIPQVKKLLLDILPSDEEKIAYHYSDGRDSKAVAKLAGVSYVTVTKWWKIWARAGIAEMMSVKGGERARRIFSLEDFGIGVPSPKKTKPKKEETEAPIEVIAEERPVQEETRGEEKNE